MEASDWIVGGTAIISMVVGIALAADPLSQAAAEMVFTEQHLGQTVCKQVGKGWKCAEAQR